MKNFKLLTKTAIVGYILLTCVLCVGCVTNKGSVGLMPKGWSPTSKLYIITDSTSVVIMNENVKYYIKKDTVIINESHQYKLGYPSPKYKLDIKVDTCGGNAR